MGDRGVKGRSIIALAFAGAALAAILAVTIGGRPSAPAKVHPTAQAAGVSGGGFTLASAAITLPDDAETLPDGPNRDLVAAQCGACHSPGMLTMQPVLKPAQWAATVKKMRDVYKAPVSDADVPAILAYLDALSARKASPAAAAAPAATAS